MTERDQAEKMSTLSDLRVLIVAPNASSLMGGEAILPLKYFQILRKRGYCASLIAHARNREELERTFSAYKDDIYYIEDTRFHRWAWQSGKFLPEAIHSPIAGNLTNQINEFYQKRLIRGLIAGGKVSLVHQPIPVSPLAPSRIYGLGVPVVIGPMNGNMRYPPGYEDYENRLSRFMIPAVRLMAGLVNFLIPGKRRADALLVANERTRDGLPFKDHPNIITLVENGVDLSIWRAGSQSARVSKPGTLKLIFMGRLIRLKALDISLKAIAKARREGIDVTLDVLGDGPERAPMEKLAAELGLRDQVRFLGFRPQQKCAELMGKADALMLNSLRECGGAVVLEAMSLGKPVIAGDWGGPPDYLDDTCGILVDPTPRSSFADRLSDAITSLANDPERRYSMGEAGIHKIEREFDWEKKIDRILEIYRDALDNRR